jgi:GNAT superfamily N-acetyltransferase
MTGRFVNKLVVDRDAGFSPERLTVYFLRYTGDVLAKRDMKKFMDVIYRNFEELVPYTELNHTRYEIARILTSPKSIIIIGTLDGQIISYLLAEVTVVENLRQLMHISYLFTSPVYRGRGIASYMLNLIQDYAEEQNIGALSLTFDTYDTKLEKFYFNNYFTYDSNLRSYQRFDMLVKYV